MGDSSIGGRMQGLEGHIPEGCIGGRVKRGEFESGGEARRAALGKYCRPSETQAKPVMPNVQKEKGKKKRNEYFAGGPVMARIAVGGLFS